MMQQSAYIIHGELPLDDRWEEKLNFTKARSGINWVICNIHDTNSETDI